MLPRTAAPRAALSLLLGLVRLLLLAAAGARGEGSSPASAPASGAPSLAATAPAASRAAAVPAMPECGFVTVASPSCDFRDVKSQRAVVTMADPTVTVTSALDTTVRDVPFGGNSLRQLLQATFPAKPSKPSNYDAAPRATFTVTPSGGGAAVSGTAPLVPSRKNSVKASPPRGVEVDGQYVVKALERGPGNDGVGGFPAGRCTMLIRAPCSLGCPEGEADFGAGCVAVCPPGQVNAGSGCATPAADTCPTGTCIARDACTYADKVCATGSICIGATVVSAECADRSAFGESPCACSALQQLAALSPSLPTEAPWNDLANAAYCVRSTLGIGRSFLEVECAPVDGVQLPTEVFGSAGLAGALPSSLGDLGPSLTYLGLSSNALKSVPTELGALTGLGILYLDSNAITALPTELGALTGLTYLDLYNNAITSVPTELAALTGVRLLALYDNRLTGVPAEFRAVDPVICDLSGNPDFSCANVGAGTSCCDADNCPAGTSTCYQG